MGFCIPNNTRIASSLVFSCCGGFFHVKTIPFCRALRLPTMLANLFIKLSGIVIIACALFSSEESLAQKIPKPKLKIELGQHFQNDKVKIWLDKKLVYNKVVFTPDSLAFSDVFEVPKPKNDFTIIVEVNGEKFEQSRPKKQKELNDEFYSLLINYDRAAEEIEIKTKTVIILYD